MTPAEDLLDAADRHARDAERLLKAAAEAQEEPVSNYGWVLLPAALRVNADEECIVVGYEEINGEGTVALLCHGGQIRPGDNQHQVFTFMDWKDAQGLGEALLEAADQAGLLWWRENVLDQGAEFMLSGDPVRLREAFEAWKATQPRG